MVVVEFWYFLFGKKKASENMQGNWGLDTLRGQTGDSLLLNFNLFLTSPPFSPRNLGSRAGRAHPV